MMLSPKWLALWIIAALAAIVGAFFLGLRGLRRRRKSAQVNLLAYAPTEAKSYYYHLIGEYSLIPHERVPQQYDEKIKAITSSVERDPNAPTWDDLLAFEMIIVQIAPPEYLLRKAW